MGYHFKACRRLAYIVVMAHPAYAFFRYSVKERIFFYSQLRLSVLAQACGAADFSALHIGHELGAVADPQHRYPQIEDFPLVAGGFFVIHAVWAAGENDSLIPGLTDLFERGAVGLDHRIHSLLPHPPGDELVILAAEIQNQHGFFHFLWHGCFRPSI